MNIVSLVRETSRTAFFMTKEQTMLERKQQPLIESHHQPAPFYPANIQPLMQSLLATLADFDYAHEKDLEKLNEARMDVRLKQKLVEKLMETHRARCTPYLEEIAALYQDVKKRLSSAGGG